MKGFTLLELLVVLVIIGIMAGFAVLQIGDRSGDWLKDEVKRIEIVVRLAREEAILEGREYGMAFSEKGYTFYELDDEGENWLPVEADDLLKDRGFPEGLHYLLIVEDQVVPLEEELPESPQVFVFSSGEVTPFSIEFDPDDMDLDEVVVMFDGLGRVVEPEL